MGWMDIDELLWMLFRVEMTLNTIGGGWTTVDHAVTIDGLKDRVVETGVQCMVIIVPTIAETGQCMESIVPKIVMAKEVVITGILEEKWTVHLGRIRMARLLGEIEMTMGHLHNNDEIMSLLVLHRMVVIEMVPPLGVILYLLPARLRVRRDHVTILVLDRDETGMSAVHEVIWEWQGPVVGMIRFIAVTVHREEATLVQTDRTETMKEAAVTVRPIEDTIAIASFTCLQSEETLKEENGV